MGGGRPEEKEHSGEITKKKRDAENQQFATYASEKVRLQKKLQTVKQLPYHRWSALRFRMREKSALWEIAPIEECADNEEHLHLNTVATANVNKDGDEVRK